MTGLRRAFARLERAIGGSKHAPAAPQAKLPLTPALYAHHGAVPAGDWRWPDFAPGELACRGDGSLLLAPAALDRLQALRSGLGRPLVLTSAYRSPLHNARVGGAPKSRHKEGDAFDISLHNLDREALRRAAEAVGFTGFGHYRTFLHVDCGPERTWGTWT